MRPLAALVLVLALPAAAQDWEPISHAPNGPWIGYAPQAVAVSADGDIALSPTTTAQGGLADGVPFVDAQTGGVSTVEIAPDRGFNTLAMAWSGTSLYVGLQTNEPVEADGQSLTGLARYDAGAGTWDGLEGGIDIVDRSFNNIVYDLAVGADGRVYAGGDFERAGGAASNYFAVWDPAGRTWSDLGGGPGGRTFALAVGADGTVFTTGSYPNTVFFRTYDPTSGTWSDIDRDFVGTADALAVDPASGTLYAGGSLRTDNRNRFRLAAYASGAWTQVPVPSVTDVSDLAWDAEAGVLYVATGGQLRTYDPGTDTWSDVLVEVTGEIQQVSVGAGRVAVVGGFSTATVPPNTEPTLVSPNVVVQSASGAWNGVGSSVHSNLPFVGDTGTAIYDLAERPDGASVYAIGLFEVAGGERVNSVARWDLATRSWNALGDGAVGSANNIGVGNDGKVYAAGAVISGISGSTLLAQWDPATETWAAVPEVSGVSRVMEPTPDGRLFVRDSGTPFRLFDPASGTVDDLEGGPPVADGLLLNAAPALAPDGTVYLAQGARDDQAQLFVTVHALDPTARTWSALPEPPVQTAHVVYVTSDGTLYLGGGDQTEPREGLLRFRNGAWEAVAGTPEAVYSLDETPDGVLLAAGVSGGNDAPLYALDAASDALVEWGFLDGNQSYIAPSFAFDASGGVVVGGAFRRGGAREDLTYSPHVLRYTGALGSPVAAERGPEAAALALGPNPTAGRFTLRADLGAATSVRATIHDLLGREVAVLADGPVPPGAFTLGADLSALPAGLYVVRLAAGDEVRTARVTVVR